MYNTRTIYFSDSEIQSILFAICRMVFIYLSYLFGFLVYLTALNVHCKTQLDNQVRRTK